jgi:dsDNA-specific endonuclease/ATPase MutS2
MVPDNTLELLEFPKLLRLIAGFANSEASGKSVLEIGPLYDKAEVETKQRQISEIRMMSQQGKPLKLCPFSDISPLFSKIKPEGAVLEAIELAEFIPVLNIAFDI